MVMTLLLGITWTAYHANIIARVIGLIAEKYRRIYYATWLKEIRR